MNTQQNIDAKEKRERRRRNGRKWKRNGRFSNSVCNAHCYLWAVDEKDEKDEKPKRVERNEK